MATLIVTSAVEATAQTGPLPTAAPAPVCVRILDIPSLTDLCDITMPSPRPAAVAIGITVSPYAPPDIQASIGLPPETVTYLNLLCGEPVAGPPGLVTTEHVLAVIDNSPSAAGLINDALSQYLESFDDLCAKESVLDLVPTAFATIFPTSTNTPVPVMTLTPPAPQTIAPVNSATPTPFFTGTPPFTLGVPPTPLPLPSITPGSTDFPVVPPATCPVVLCTDYYAWIPARSVWCLDVTTEADCRRPLTAPSECGLTTDRIGYADCNRNSDGAPHRDADQHSNGNTDRNAHGVSNPDADADGISYAYSNRNTNGDPYGDADNHSDRDANRNTDSNAYGISDADSN